jgi:SAM-dependent methyltransferase
LFVTTVKTPTAAPKPLDFDDLFAAEDRHFWFRNRNAVLRAQVERIVRTLPNGYRVLEVGCGTGYVLRMLEQTCTRGEVIGIDLFEEGLAFARRRVSCPVLAADIHDLPFEDSFDLIGMFDVLEHVPDDGRVLRDLRSRLKPDGTLLMTVPAHMALWSYFDEYAEHYRRYSPESLRQVLEREGYFIDYMTQFMTALYPAMWVRRKLNAQAASLPAEEARTRGLDELRSSWLANQVFGLLLGCEPALTRRQVTLPLGTSLLAVCRAHNS